MSEHTVIAKGISQLTINLYNSWFLWHFILLFLNSCSAEGISEHALIGKGISQFTINLYNAIREDVGANENIFVSPYSISTVTAMVLAGAQGDTRKQLSDILHVGNLSTEDVLAGFRDLLTRMHEKRKGVALDTANHLYIQQGYGILESYQESVTKHFQAGVEAVDFSADKTRTAINKWVEGKTKQKIKDLIPEGSKGETAPAPFHLSGIETVDVQMMHNYDLFNVGNNTNWGVRTLEMRYKDRDLAMVIVLPDEIEGLNSLEGKLKENPNGWKDIIQTMREREVELSMPRFKIESNFELSRTLKKMGAADLFDSEAADLSGISGKKDLFASAMFHKTFINVDEEGTEAAAATGLVITPISGFISPPEPPFVVDRPFLFFIRSIALDTVLFAGSVRKP